MFFPQSNWLASVHLLFHPFLLICVITIFFISSPFSVYNSLPQWPFHRSPCFPLLFSSQSFCTRPLSSAVFVLWLFFFSMPFPLFIVGLSETFLLSLEGREFWSFLLDLKLCHLSTFFFVSQFFRPSSFLKQKKICFSCVCVCMCDPFQRWMETVNGLFSSKLN